MKIILYIISTVFAGFFTFYLVLLNQHDKTWVTQSSILSQFTFEPISMYMILGFFLLVSAIAGILSKYLPARSYKMVMLGETKEAEPKLDIKLFVAPGINQYPLQNYSLIVQNMNRKSVPITDLRIEFMFKNIVSEVKTHSTSLDSAGTVSFYETKNGKSTLVYEDQTEETALTRHFSLNIQKAKIRGITINTNLVWFDCDVWPEKMSFFGDIKVDLSKIPEIHKRPEKEGTYYGTYSYTVNGKKVSKTITGIIPDALSSQADPREGSLVYQTDDKWLEKNNALIDFTPHILKDDLEVHVYRDKDNTLKVKIRNSLSGGGILEYSDFDKLKKMPQHPKHMVVVTWKNGENKLYIDGFLADVFPKP